jgi:rhamnosyl/mannosyltransferase
MKVLHVYRTYFPDTQGGLEEVIRQICLNALPHGVESRVFCLSKNPNPAQVDSEGGLIVRVRQTFEIASCGFSLGGVAEFRRQVAWADLVHYHFPWPFADVLQALAGSSRPSIVTYHSDIVRQKLLKLLYQPLMNHFLGKVDRIVATSPNYYATSEVLSRMGDKVEVIPIGVQRESYPQIDDDSPLLAQVEADYGRGFFLFVGVLRYYKGLSILLDAMRDADYRVVIVGAGPMEKELRQQVKAQQLDNVQFGGYVNDQIKMALYKLSRAVVFPSYLRAEAFGVTLLEGAMCGKPLISAEVGAGSSHINIHAQTGLVVTPGCSRSLREAMDSIYYHPGRAEVMGQRARARFAEYFTGSLMGRRYAGLYQQILQREPVGPAQLVGRGP